jgi:hypothetical protein
MLHLLMNKEKNSHKAIIYNNIYHNSLPVINKFMVSSNGKACANCSDSYGGSLNTVINMNVSDDLDSPSELQYRICTKSGTSKQHCDAYTQYDSQDFNEKQIYYTIKSPSDYIAGSTATDVTLSLDVKDSDGDVSSQDYVYKLYPNQAPVITI